MKAIPRSATATEIKDTIIGKIPLDLYLVKNEELFKPLDEFKKGSI